ncbi:MAG: pyrroloquinoline quinone-dependent dehydrogenase, partial [Rhodospirillaceae bacterium]|nr:pyrroloquinoline quinone-dependent dehydrogenase [Rhodospirillaceae bacterium]
MRLGALLAAIAISTTAVAQEQSVGDWPAFGNDPGGSQSSPLAQITPENVKGLKLAWTHRSGDVAGRDSDTGATALEAVPIHVNNTLYYCTPFNRVFALDPATGEEKWVFDPHAPGPDGKALSDKPRKAGICRSVAYWQAAEPQAGAACQKRIFKGDLDGKVYAMDADTGASCQDFGAGEGHPGYVTHFDFEAYGTNDTSRGMTSGPLVIGDIVVAAQGARDSISDANNGIVRAFDVRSGELKWEFDPIPRAHAHDTGAANVWSTMSADPARGLVFVPTTSPSSDYFGGNRTFDIPYSDATVALSAATGQPVWHYQIIDHDLFDHDVPGHPLLVTITKDGQKRDVAIQPAKIGSVFVLDRDTGTPLFPVEDRPVPQSDLPGEKTAATQRFPVLPEPISRQTLSEDDMWGLTPIDRAWCQTRFREMRYEGHYTPPSERGTLIFPFGGTNWGGVAYDAKTNLLIAKGQNMALRLKVTKKEPESDPPYRVEPALFLSPLGAPCTPPPFGTVSAVDMDTGKIKWQVPLGQAKYLGITAPKFLEWGSPNIGGPMVTGGGLVFIAASLDAKLRALDVQTGEELWQHGLAAPGMSVPMT